ncbi:MAG: Kelch repeat-containing protein [Bdellovibrionales bacterium]
MKRRFLPFILNCLLVFIVLSHNNCRYQYTGQPSSKDSTIVGNPMTEPTVATFKPKGQDSSILICVTGLRLASMTKTQEVRFALPQLKTITNGGIDFAALEVPPGLYDRVQMQLADSCQVGHSLKVSNTLGDWQVTDDLQFNFAGDVDIGLTYNRLTFNIQSIFDQLETVTSSGDILNKVRLADGLVTTPDIWVSLNSQNAPSARYYHASTWTGRELLVWGGYSTGQYHQTGARYDPSTDRWTSISNVGSPTPRYVYGSVWTGQQMIVWGGLNSLGQAVNTGALYDPNQDSWRAISTIGAPSPRLNHTSVWTGSKMIVWGGEDAAGNKVNDGGIYDPALNSWLSISSVGAPGPRVHHSALWTGTEMLIWGGCHDVTLDCGSQNPGLNSGARFNPQTNTWSPMTLANAPSPRYGQTAVWSGTEMIIWSGNRYDNTMGSFLTGDGGRYNPATNSWQTMPSDSRVTPRVEGVAVWTGAKMLIWGGRDYNFTDINSSALYDPILNSWTPISPQNAPQSRRFASAIWTGFEIVIWGGWQGGAAYLNSGGRYRP